LPRKAHESGAKTPRPAAGRAAPIAPQLTALSEPSRRQPGFVISGQGRERRSRAVKSAVVIGQFSYRPLMVKVLQISSEALMVDRYSANFSLKSAPGLLSRNSSTACAPLSPR